MEQRAALKQAGRAQEQPLTPHLLVMSATPIPRSLALTVYGDLDLSIIDELPPGRQPIKTYVIHPDERERAYGFVQSQVAQGRQVYIICPLVEESEQTEARAAVAEHERLQREVFPRLSLGLLHGRMRGDEKETVMQAFARNETQVLVSTSVVEVGIDVPNATVMLVEGANHFGLAQLHQFAGASAAVSLPPSACCSSSVPIRQKMNGCGPWCRRRMASSWPRLICNCAAPAISWGAPERPTQSAHGQPG